MSRQDRQWICKPIDPKKDRNLLCRAREQFFGERDEQYVNWLYYNNPAGEVYCSLAMDEDKIAGQYIIIPIDMIVTGKALKATLSLDTYTNPEYRRQGIFTALAKDLYARAAQKGIPFTLGLPNENSRPGFINNLDFCEPLRVYQTCRPTAPWPGAGTFARRLMSKLPLFHADALISRRKRLEFAVTDAPEDEWVDELWRNYARQVVVDLKKDARWLRWRYLENPRFSYRFGTATGPDGRPMGYIVWNVERDQPGRISKITAMDLVAVDFPTRIALIQHLLNEIALDAHMVRIMSSFSSPAANALAVMGFIPYKRVSFIVRDHGIGFDMGRLLKSGAWPISTCYADSF